MGDIYNVNYYYGEYALQAMVKKNDSMTIQTQKYRWTEVCASVYLCFMFLGFPLYYQDNYINMLAAKTSFFVISTVIYLAVGVVSIGLVRLSTDNSPAKYKNKSKKSGRSGIRQSKSKECYECTTCETGDMRRLLIAQDTFFLIFLIAVLLSTFASGDIHNAWLAPECKRFGAMVILLCCGIYCLISRGYILNRIVKSCLAVGLIAVFALTVLNRYGIDPLDMYSNLMQSQKYKYLSTIGNANILSNFICVFAPLAIGIYLFSKNKAELIAGAILTYMGVMAGVAANSDSFFLGIGAAAIFLMWFVFDDKVRLTRFAEVVIVCDLALLTLKLFNSLTRHDCKWDRLQEILIDEIPWMLILIIWICLRIVIGRLPVEFDLKKVRNILYAVIGAGMVIAVIVIIRINITGDYDSYFYFDDDWGTNRGFVWSRTWQLFSELPFYQQITGVGPGGFREFFAEFNVERAKAGLPAFSDPHSEPLYFLVSTGIGGFIGYFGLIITAIVNCTKIRAHDTVIFAAIFVSWLAQGMVNNPLVFTTPYLFIFLAMSRYNVRLLK